MQQLSSTWVHFFLAFWGSEMQKKHKNTIDISLKKTAKNIN